MKLIPAIPDEEWCQYYSAVDELGKEVMIWDRSACAWCVTAWMTRHLCRDDKVSLIVYNVLLDEELMKMYLMGNAKPKDAFEALELVALWNDCVSTTVGQVNQFLGMLNHKIKDL